jgi:hypothetical protein
MTDDKPDPTQDDGLLGLLATALFHGVGAVAGAATADTAASAIVVVRAIVGAARGAATHQVTVEEAHAELRKLIVGLTANDAAADEALDAKFPLGED